MMRRIALLLLVGLWVWPAGAGAHTTVIAPEGSATPYQAWVDQAKVPTPEMTITLVEEACAEPPSWAQGASTCTDPETGKVWFGWTGAPWYRQHAFFHELGHNFDYRMPAWVRSRYLAILGRPPLQPWLMGNRWSPNEVFAESYAFCAVRAHLAGNEPVSETDVIGGWRAHNRICALIRNAYRYMS